MSNSSIATKSQNEFLPKGILHKSSFVNILYNTFCDYVYYPITKRIYHPKLSDTFNATGTYITKYDLTFMLCNTNNSKYRLTESKSYHKRIPAGMYMHIRKTISIDDDTIVMAEFDQEYGLYDVTELFIDAKTLQINMAYFNHVTD